MKGHEKRVLFLAKNPTGNTLVSGAGDETLRFWDLNLNNPRLSISDGLGYS